MSLLRRFPPLLLCLLALAGLTRPAAAQLARSFYNIVGIDTRILPNGLQIIVRADGAINLGVDRDELVKTDPTGIGDDTPLSLQSFRLRFVGARAQIPAFTNIGSYPADFVEADLGHEDLKGRPFFYGGADPSKTDPSIPRLDLRFHFYVPIKVTYFTLIYGRGYGWNYAYAGMQPREASVAVAADKRSVIITVISDRVETVRRQNSLTRSPAAAQKHRLSITGGSPPEAPLHIDILHAPLAQVADEMAHATGLPLIVPAAESAADVTLFLPDIKRDDVLRILARACGLAVQPRPTEEGGGFVLVNGAHGSDERISDNIPLRHLRPENARLLLPDFLLPYTRVDSEHNALIVNANPDIVERIRKDITLLDHPRPQVCVQAHVYELEHDSADSLSLQATLSGGRPALDTGAENLGVTIQSGQLRSYTATLTALVARNRARLVAEPQVTVASGETGTLFAGQTRYLTVLQTDYGYGNSGGQNVQAIQLPVGTTLTVTPTACASDGEVVPVTLDLSAGVATVDSIDAATGLPTVGTRQITGVVQVRTDGEAVLIAGLQSVDDSRTHRHLALSRLPLLGHLIDYLTRSHDDEADQTDLIVLVTARIVGDSDPAASRRIEEKL